MRHRKLLAAAMSAVMVLAGCNADKSADKPAEAVMTGAATSPVVEELTTEATTTAASTTTTSATTTMTTTKTTTAPKEPELPESDFGCFLQDDGTVYISWYEGTDKDVIIPEYIGEYPVTSMMLPLKPESHPDKDTKIETVTLPRTITRLQFHDYDEYQTIKSYIVDPENEKYTAVDGVLYSKDMTKLVLYPPAKEGEFTVPESVTEIGGGSFAYADKISTVNIGSNVKTIGYMAFKVSSVSKVNIAEGLESIDHWAFLHCLNLTGITLPTSINEIGDSIFVDTPLNTVELIECGGDIYMKDGILFKGSRMITMMHDSTVDTLIIDGHFETDSNAFKGQTGLKEVIITDGSTLVTTGELDYEFWECGNIRRMYIPASVENCYIGTGSGNVTIYTQPDSWISHNTTYECVYVDSYEEYLKVTSENG